MRAWPDAPAVQAGLARVWRRLALVRLVHGLTAGTIVAAVLVLVGWRMDWPAQTAATAALLPIVLGAAMAIRRARRSRASVALELERRAPACRNVVVTAAQILSREEPVRDDIGARICRDAAEQLARIDLSRLVPIRGSLAALAAVALATTALAIGMPARTTAAGTLHVDPDAAAISRIDAQITPPAYSGRPAESSRDPKSLTVLSGSTIDLSVNGQATSVAIEAPEGSVTLASAATAGTFAGRVTAAKDGFIAIEPHAADGRPGPRTLIGLTVVPDRPPVVRITAPGRDLLLPPGPHRLDVTIEAADDLGLGALRLEYTRVSGSGESFEFKRGDVPLTIARANDREWRATASWSLTSLDLQPGDMVVYRGVAADRRPGATPVESDALIVEIAAPGSVAAEGFAMDDQHDRYALSQRMVIVKTERLIARRATMSADDVAEEAHGIAAEQRSVRAEFIFMMGGELEGVTSGGEELNEEAEAAGEADLLAGRARNRGRIDLLIATRRMSEAAGALTTTDLAKALPAERAALDALQRAFAKDRYLLRAFATRERPDPARRMTGTLKETTSDRRPAEAPPADPSIDTLRRALGSASALARRTTWSRDEAAVVTVAADAVLRLNPSSETFRGIAASLNSAATAMLTGSATTSAELANATSSLAAALAIAQPAAPPPPDDARTQRLKGAVGDARQKAGGR